MDAERKRFRDILLEKERKAANLAKKGRTGSYEVNEENEKKSFADEVLYLLFLFFITLFIYSC